MTPEEFKQAMTPEAIKLRRATSFLLELAKGNIPTYQRGLGGVVKIDWRAVQAQARNAYEVISQAQSDCIDFSSTG